MTGVELLPAAEYLRFSKPTQRYSMANQQKAIRAYAIKNGFRVVRTYVDPGKTGVNLRQRPALKKLLRDVNSGHAGFKAILTYDISRWGRFQDSDESASYEFVCKQAGIKVHYCAEEFFNDGSPSSSIMKILKRTMAAEYSREISVKVSAGQRRLAMFGFHMGGPAPFGMNRMMISASGGKKRRLRHKERKGSQQCHVVLIPGRKSEVACVRRIFALAADEQKMPIEVKAGQKREYDAS
jgi:DNA invertase Pin-like site-specific DNA recombinase